MGNSPSLTRSLERNRWNIELIKGDREGKWEELNVRLLCQKNIHETALNGLPIGEAKDAITNFLKEVYDTSDAVAFHWTTWDTDHAEIVLSTLDGTLDEENTAPVFDAMVELHCEIACPGSESAPPPDDYRDMCRMLKTGGLLVVPRDFSEVNHIASIHPEYICRDPTGAELVTIFAVSPDGQDTAKPSRASDFWVWANCFSKNAVMP